MAAGHREIQTNKESLETWMQHRLSPRKSSETYDDYLVAMKQAHHDMSEDDLMSPRVRHRHKLAADNEKDKKQKRRHSHINEDLMHISTIASMVPDEIIYNYSDNAMRSYETALMFIDVSGFTELCESYTKSGRGGPSKLTQVLNSYIGAMVQEILTHNGDVLKFAGDAFLSMWKKTAKMTMQDVVHTAIDCGLIIQKNYATHVTDLGVTLKVKVAISAGVSHFAIIGGEPQATYIIVGQPVWDVKAAEYMSHAGDVLTSASTWAYVNEAEYCTQPCGDGRHTKVLGVGVTWKRVEKIDFASTFKYSHDLSASATRLNVGKNVMSVEEAMDKTEAAAFKEYSLRPAVISTLRSSWWPSLRRFMVAPVLRAVDNDEPMDFLTEVRHVVVVFLNIITSTVTEDVLVDVVDAAYKRVCSVTLESGGLVNKVSMFDKDMMFLVVFGLRGLKHEDEVQKALLCAFQLKETLQDPKILCVSIGVTSGRTYCGVVGHVLRREYTVIGSSVNKAARLMMSYPDKVTCDKETFVRSKLDLDLFRLMEPKLLKGIAKPGPVYEFSKSGWPERRMFIQHPILGRNEELRTFRQALENAAKRQHERFTRYRDLQYGIIVMGPRLVGKKRMVDEFISITPNQHKILKMALTAADKTPYAFTRLLLQKIYTGSNTNVKSVRDIFANRIRHNIGMMEITPLQIHALNTIFNLRFPLPETFSYSGDILSELSVKELIRELFNLNNEYLIVVAVDDGQFIDDESWRVLLPVLDVKSIFLIIIINDHDQISDVAKTAVANNVFVKMHLRGIDRWYHSALACQLLDVQAIPADLEKVLESASSGLPGWIQNFVISLVQRGELTVVTVPRSEAVHAGAVMPLAAMLQRDHDVDIISATTVVQSVHRVFEGASSGLPGWIQNFVISLVQRGELTVVTVPRSEAVHAGAVMPLAAMLQRDHDVDIISATTVVQSVHRVFEGASSGLPGWIQNFVISLVQRGELTVVTVPRSEAVHAGAVMPLAAMLQRDHDVDIISATTVVQSVHRVFEGASSGLPGWIQNFVISLVQRGELTVVTVPRSEAVHAGAVMPLAAMLQRDHDVDIISATTVVQSVHRVFEGASSGLPGWIQNFVISLVQRGELTVVTVPRSEAVHAGAVMPLAAMLQRDHDVDIISATTVVQSVHRVFEGASSGLPGWIQNFVISLVQRGELTVVTVPRSEAVHAGAVMPLAAMLQRDHDVDIISATTSTMSKTGEISADNETIQMAVLAENYNFDDMKVDMNMDVIILKTYDSLTPFEKMLLKCGSVLGEIFCRRMLLHLLQSDSERKVAKAVARLFEIRVLECEGGDFSRDTSMVLIHSAPVPTGAVKPPNCACLGTRAPPNCRDLPMYAFCGYMKFRHSLFRTTTYELLTENQKLEMHSRSLMYLERYTRRCTSCGAGCFINLFGVRSDDGMIHESKQVRRVRQQIVALSAETRIVSESLSDAGVTSIDNAKPTQSDKNIEDEGEKQNRSQRAKSIKKLKAVRSFSSLDLENCECLPILLSVYHQVVDHCRAVGDCQKLFETYMEYVDLSLLTVNIPQAIRLLMDAEDDSEAEKCCHSLLCKIPWIRDYQFARILTLRGCCMLESGEVSEARKHLLRAMELYGCKFPTSNVGVKFCDMQASLQQNLSLCTPKRFKSTCSRWVGKFYDNIATTLIHLFRLFMECKELEKATLAAKWSLKFARKSNSTFRVLCLAYGNMISIYRQKQNFSKCLKLEKLAMEICHRKRGHLDITEIYSVCILYTNLFFFYVDHGNKGECLDFGLSIIPMMSSQPDITIGQRLVQWTLKLLLSDLRIQDMVMIMREFFYMTGFYDLSSEASYYYHALLILLDTGYCVESYDACEKFYIKQGDAILRSKAPVAAWNFFACMWLVTLRIGAWERAILWEEKAKKILPVAFQRIEYLLLVLRLLECFMIRFVNEIDDRNLKKIIMLEKRVKTIFGNIKKILSKIPLFRPRFFLLYAYYHQVKGKKSTANKYLNKAYVFAKQYGNTVMQIWIDHTKEHWKGTLSPKLKDFWTEHIEVNSMLDYKTFDPQTSKIVPYTLPLPKDFE